MTVTAASSASPREQAVMSTASGADVDEIKREITEIYSIHNPQKLGQLGALWQKYAGREAQMLAGVRNKYGVSDGGRSGHSVTRREIERLYTEYEPAKLNDVASLCLEHGEGALLKQVREQYAAATPESTPRHVEQLDEDERRRYGGVVLTEEREDSCTVFKMQMAVVGGTKTGFMTENAPLTAAEPRFEVTVVTDESVHGDKDATKAYRCDPKENRLLVFPGDLLHGVVPGPSNKTEQPYSKPRARLVFLSSSARLHVLRVRVLTWVCIVRAGEQTKSSWRPLICQ